MRLREVFQLNSGVSMRAGGEEKLGVRRWGGRVEEVYGERWVKL